MAQDKPTLAETLNFSEDDLTANRQGRLSEGQKKRLVRGWRRTLWIMITLVILFGLIATIMIFLGQRNDSPILTVLGVIVTIINATIVGVSAQSYLRTSSDVGAGKIATIDGVVSHTIRVSGRAATYVLKVDTQEIVVPKPVFFAVEDRKPYHFYRAPASKTLLAAEPG